MSRRLSGCALALGAVVFGVQGCSSGGDKVTAPNYTIALHLGSSSGSIAQGSSSQFSVTVTRGGGYTGNLTFTVEGAPTGVSGSASEHPDQRHLDLRNDHADGRRVRRRGRVSAHDSRHGERRHRRDGDLHPDRDRCRHREHQPRCRKPIARALRQRPGDHHHFAQQFHRDGQPHDRDLPTGVTVSFNPAAVTGTSSTATVTVGASVAANTYNLTVHGTGTGVSDATTTIVLTVTAPAGLHACGAAHLPQHRTGCEQGNGDHGYSNWRLQRYDRLQRIGSAHRRHRDVRSDQHLRHHHVADPRGVRQRDARERTPSPRPARPDPRRRRPASASPSRAEAGAEIS